MTLRDLIAGHWTWLQLLRETVTLLVLAVAAFYAGYWRGRLKEQARTMAVIRRLPYFAEAMQKFLEDGE